MYSAGNLSLHRKRWLRTNNMFDQKYFGPRSTTLHRLFFGHTEDLELSNQAWDLLG